MTLKLTAAKPNNMKSRTKQAKNKQEEETGEIAINQRDKIDADSEKCESNLTLF